MNWHTLDIAAVLKETASSDKGLTAEAAAAALKKHGPNELKAKKQKPAWVIFLNQFSDFMIIVLAVAAVISGIAGDFVDTIIILFIILLNAIVGFVQEYRAEKTMQALQKMAAPTANVMRNGQATNVPSAELVPGDMVLLEAGQIVPADLRLTEAHSLRIEESSLTGESVPADKTTSTITEQELSPGDKLNMAFKATKITNGRGSGVVVETGANTEIGKIAGMLQEDQLRTPLQARMTSFGKKLSYLILIICVVLFGVGWMRGEDPMNMLLVSISLAVAAIPEALPALITIALAGGAKRLAKKNVVVRKLHAVETLGSVTFICSDKTGTLTQNKMTVTEIKPVEEAAIKPDEDLSLLEWCMTLNHDVVKDDTGEWKGDPTEIAITNYVQAKHSEEKLSSVQNSFPREAELPFDSDRKRMTTIHKYEGGYIAISKGATESITAILEDQQLKAAIDKDAGEMAAKGMRVLAYGYRKLDKLPSSEDTEETENSMVFAGLVGMIDPPREEVKQAIQECKTAGIHPVMITGDHIETGSAIARDIGILGEGHLAITGKELAAMSTQELEEKVENIRVYGRVSPEQKLNIVKALQKKNHFVAMTGDGANDAPSLKTANIGIAMGITGTDVSKEASSMILLDDNFATIVKAIKEGRRIYDNIRKFVRYIMGMQ